MDEKRTIAPCNQCSGSTNHRIVHASTFWGWYDLGEQPDGDVLPEEQEPRADNPDEADWRNDYEILQCLGCDSVCVRHTSRSSHPWIEEISTDLSYYPPRLFRRLPPWEAKLPRNVRDVVQEVYAALATDSRRLAMMGARTIVDMVILDKVGDVGSFKQKLEALEERGHISRMGREHLDAALDAGNAAAHRGHSPDQTDIGNVIEIVENLLHSTYVLNRAAESLRTNTPRRSSTH